jgi:hypothetical protein
MKEGSLFCFVCDVELSQIIAPLHHACGILLENPWWVGMDGVGFIMFWHPMEKLWNIEQIFHWIYIFKSKLTIIGEFAHALDIVGKPLVSKI